jgi:serine/threonine protein kinase
MISAWLKSGLSGAPEQIFIYLFILKSPAKWDQTRNFIAPCGTAIGMLMLHQNRTIHRNLKATNVLPNDELEPKVADFGLSKVVEPSETPVQAAAFGSGLYMASEIFEESCPGYQAGDS